MENQRGLTYQSYIPFITFLSEFLKKCKLASRSLREDPTVDLEWVTQDIDKLKQKFNTIDVKVLPIVIGQLSNQMKEMDKIKSLLDSLLNEYGNIRDSIKFGNNIIDFVVFKPQAYINRKEDPEIYEKHAINIRYIYRALDYFEKYLFEVLDAVETDYNTIKLIKKVYIDRRIYEQNHQDIILDDINLYPIEEAPKEVLEFVVNKYKNDNYSSKSVMMEGSDASLFESFIFTEEGEEPKSDKNGVNRKNLYIAFIEKAKQVNRHNVFGSEFTKDIFDNKYPFIPDELRYFYRLANPLLCVLEHHLVFFPIKELKKINRDNKEMDKYFIFAGTENDFCTFDRSNGHIYQGIEENGKIKLGMLLADSFDLYIQLLVDKGNILMGQPIQS